SPWFRRRRHGIPSPECRHHCRGEETRACGRQIASRPATLPDCSAKDRLGMWDRTNKAQEHSCPPQKSRGRGHRLDNCSCPIHDCLSTPCSRGSCVRVALKRVSENPVLTCETRGILTRTGCREAVDELSLFNTGLRRRDSFFKAQAD